MIKVEAECDRSEELTDAEYEAIDNAAHCQTLAILDTAINKYMQYAIDD